MSINILFVIIVAALVVGVVWGWKRGLIEGIVRIISSILGIVVLLVVAQGIYRYTKGGIGSVIITLLLLGIIGVIQKIVKFITSTFRLVKAIPFGKLADKLAGAAFGAVEILCIIWVVFILIGSFDLFGLKQWLLEQVAQSRFLQIIYNTNYLIVFLQWIFAQFR
ncbi:MAG: CvpA family protein [Lachnospiraceae bacterium]|nr:CvpA family protein [Lachnospiraceae bacterium]